MKPGRELDVLIAEKIFGHEVTLKTWNEGKCGEWSIGKPDYYDSYGESILHNPLPNYSEDIQAAWQIVDYLAPLVGDFENADGFFKLMYADSADHGGKNCDPGETQTDEDDNDDNDDNDLTRWSAHFHPGIPGEGSEASKFFKVDSGWSCAKGETAAHALCLAALKIFEKENQDSA